MAYDGPIGRRGVWNTENPLFLKPKSGKIVSFIRKKQIPVFLLEGDGAILAKYVEAGFLDAYFKFTSRLNFRFDDTNIPKVGLVVGNYPGKVILNILVEKTLFDKLTNSSLNEDFAMNNPFLKLVKGELVLCAEKTELEKSVVGEIKVILGDKLIIDRVFTSSLVLDDSWNNSGYLH